VDEMTELRAMRASVPLLAPEELERACGQAWAADAEQTQARQVHARRGWAAGWRGRTAVALSLAAAVTATALVYLPQGGLGPRQDGQGTAGGAAATPVVELPAREVLLAAARKVEREPLGRWWLSRSVHSASLQVGPAGDRYLVERRRQDDRWIERAADGREHLISRTLGTRPLTAADEAAWRRDGSPTRWLVTDKGREIELTAAPSAPQARTQAADCLVRGGVTKRDFGRCYGVDYLLKLRADDRAALKAALLEGGVSEESALYPSYALNQGAYALTELPLRPEVRAEVFRLMADLPGVRSLGRMRDPLGREGVGIAVSGPQAGALGVQLIVDPDSGHLLARTDTVPARGSLRPGDAAFSVVFLEAGWTNQRPKL
jgi:hypothetical protein